MKRILIIFGSFHFKIILWRIKRIFDLKIKWANFRKTFFFCQKSKCRMRCLILCEIFAEVLHYSRSESLEKSNLNNFFFFWRLGKLRPSKRRAVFQRSVSGKGLLSLEVTVYDLWFEVEKEPLWFGDWPPRPHWRALHIQYTV